jgi:chromosome segregation ATPase
MTETTQKTSLQKDLDETRAKMDMQTAALNENLTTIRGDLNGANQHLKLKDEQINEALGQKLGKSCQLYLILPYSQP